MGQKESPGKRNETLIITNKNNGDGGYQTIK
jgi:hypothetical protein